jgi:8-oxo-dGTP pyrophosphatase MutT (NUDIX family)
MPVSVGVSVVILKDTSVCLILRGDFPIWCLPGGAVETGESTAEAAIREVREETGLEVRLTRLVGLYYRTHGPGGNHQALFAAEVISGEAKPDGVESLKVEWFPLDHLPERLLGIHRLSIQDALQDGPAVVRRLNILSNFARFTRQELYDLRDQGKLDLRVVLAEFCAQVEEKDIQDGLGS